MSMQKLVDGRYGFWVSAGNLSNSDVRTLRKSGNWPARLAGHVKLYGLGRILLHLAYDDKRGKLDLAEYLVSFEGAKAAA